MRSLPALCVLGLSLAAAALAQEQWTAPDTQAEEPQQNDPTGQNNQGETSPEESGSEAPVTVTLTDARLSITSLIEAFVTERSPNGFWPLLDKRTKQRRKLVLVSVDESKTKSAGEQRFSAPARLKDLRNGQALRAVFIVNFSGPKWSVVGMRLLRPATRKG